MEAVYTVNRVGTTRQQMYYDVKKAMIEKMNRQGAYMNIDTPVLFFSAEPNDMFDEFVDIDLVPVDGSAE